MPCVRPCLHTVLFCVSLGGYLGNYSEGGVCWYVTTGRVFFCYLRLVPGYLSGGVLGLFPWRLGMAIDHSV